MAIDPKEFAKKLGAVHVGSVPDCGGGAFGAARLAYIVAGMRGGPVAEAPAAETVEVVLDAAAARKLARLAERAGTAERPVSAEQFAAHLLAEAVASLPDE